MRNSHLPLSRWRQCVAVFLLLAACGTLAGEWRLSLPGYRYEFPRDHLDHPEFQTEWWYFTGNLQSADGRPFGYELTFFRQGRDVSAAEQGTWSTGQLYLAHLALTDIRAERFHHEERLNREGPGLAGIHRPSQRIWNGNWQVTLGSNGTWQLQAVSPDFTLRLQLRPTKAPVLHGENGVHQKAEGAGRASHYISLTRLATQGELEIGGSKLAVTGSSWMDHEFFTHQLGEGQTGWDWFAIQLDDQSELMLYRLRRRDGSVEPLSGGTFVRPDGSTQRVSLRDVSLRSTRSWSSPRTGATYPIAWEIEAPTLGLSLRAEPRMDAQELVSERKLGPSYWEGAMRFTGTRQGKPVSGQGYLEMTGYADEVRFGPDNNRGGMTR